MFKVILASMTIVSILLERCRNPSSRRGLFDLLLKASLLLSKHTIYT